MSADEGKTAPINDAPDETSASSPSPVENLRSLLSSASLNRENNALFRDFSKGERPALSEYEDLLRCGAKNTVEEMASAYQNAFPNVDTGTKAHFNNKISNRLNEAKKGVIAAYGVTKDEMKLDYTKVQRENGVIERVNKKAGERRVARKAAGMSDEDGHVGGETLDFETDQVVGFLQDVMEQQPREDHAGDCSCSVCVENE